LMSADPWAPLPSPAAARWVSVRLWGGCGSVELKAHCGWLCCIS
jgi:hypothetical protein